MGKFYNQGDQPSVIHEATSTNPWTVHFLSYLHGKGFKRLRDVPRDQLKAFFTGLKKTYKKITDKDIREINKQTKKQEKK
jgi:hypothetical protein